MRINNTSFDRLSSEVTTNLISIIIHQQRFLSLSLSRAFFFSSLRRLFFPLRIFLSTWSSLFRFLSVMHLQGQAQWMISSDLWKMSRWPWTTCQEKNCYHVLLSNLADAKEKQVFVVGRTILCNGFASLLSLHDPMNIEAERLRAFLPVRTATNEWEENSRMKMSSFVKGNRKRVKRGRGQGSRAMNMNMYILTRC